MAEDTVLAISNDRLMLKVLFDWFANQPNALATHNGDEKNLTTTEEFPWPLIILKLRNKWTGKVAMSIARTIPNASNPCLT